MSDDAGAAPGLGSPLPPHPGDQRRHRGSLQAFTELLQHMPPESGLAFVLIQHLDPQQPSLLRALLAAHTADLHLSGLDGARLPLAVETTIYRLVQEALTNVLTGD